MASRAVSEDLATTLEEACARNVSVELHHYDDVSKELIVTRTRMIGLDDENVLLDSPQSIGKTVSYETGQEVETHFLFASRRYTFCSSITSTRCSVRLNESKTIIGMSVARPADVKDGQRRHEFRISLARIEPISVHLHEASAEDPNACSIDAARFCGRLVNLSSGGVRVRVEKGKRRNVRIGEYFFIEFEIPDGHGPLIFLVELRNVHRIQDNTASLLGFSFLRWTQNDIRRKERRLEQFGAEMQRRGHGR